MTNDLYHQMFEHKKNFVTGFAERLQSHLACLLRETTRHLQCRQPRLPDIEMESLQETEHSGDNEPQLEGPGS